METLKDVFLKKYPQYGKVLRVYEEVNETECTFESITKPRLYNFVQALNDRLATNSAKTYCAMFKSVLNLYSDMYSFPKGFEAILTLKKDATQSTWLTDEEIKKLLSYDPVNDTERIVKNCFLLGCLTGARHSDYVCFTEDNIIDRRLVYISQKTKTKAEIPAAPAVLRILEENKKYNLSQRKLSDVTFNDTIRSICRKCGINQRIKLYQAGEYATGEKWEFISSHSARKSCATNLYLRGADLYSISRMLGHSSVTMTETYICCGLRELSDKIMGYFNGFK